MLVAFLLVNAPNCHLSLVLASVVQGDAVNCNRLIRKCLNTFHSELVICLADLPNVPYRYVFWQLSSEVSHLHRTPLKSRQSAKIRTTVV